MTIHLKRSVSIRLGRLAREALAGGRGSPHARISSQTVRAIRCYLHDSGSGGPGWAYPAFRRRGGGGEDEIELRLDLDDGLWHALEEEATKQGVTTEQLAEHAALYYAAEVHAGRITERILEDVDEEMDY